MKIFLLAILLLLAVAYAGNYERSERRAVLVYYSDDKCRHLEGIAGTFISNAQRSVQSSNRGSCREQLACVHNDASEDCHDVRNYGTNVLINFNLNRENYLLSRNNGAPLNQTYDTCYASGLFSACHYKVVREREALRRFDDDEWRHHGEHHDDHHDEHHGNGHWDHDDDEHHGHGRPGQGKPGRPSGEHGRPDHGEHGRPEHGRPGQGKPGRPHSEHGRPDHGEHGRPNGEYGRPDHGEHGRPNGEHGRPNGEHGRPDHGEHGRPNGEHGRPNGEHGRPNDEHDHDDHHGEHRPDWDGEWDHNRDYDDEDKKRTLGKSIVEEVKVAEPVTATAQN